MIAPDTPITFHGDRMRVGFDYRSPAAYELFLRVKRLPEYEIELDPVGLAAAVTAPARFAGMLGLERPRSLGDELPLSGFLFDDQAAILRMALDAKRFAVWSDCGLGKTPIGLEFARQIVAMTGGRVLIVTLNEIVPQWFTEAEKFYGPGCLPMVRIESREELKRWCATGETNGTSSIPAATDPLAGGDGRVLPAVGGENLRQGERHLDRRSNVRVGGTALQNEAVGTVSGDGRPLAVSVVLDGSDCDAVSPVLREARETKAQIAVVNYEKFNHRGDIDQEVSEIKLLAGIILDESSRLKTGGGKQKWALIKSAKGVEYKLSLTATPAPNEIMEFASQASFLEKMRSDNEIIWTYFRRDEKTHRWTVKPHARKAFFEFMAGWSIYVRDPRKYGWRLGVERPPEPIMFRHELKLSQEQRDLVLAINADGANVSEANRGSMFAGELNAIAANKLSQAAKGFQYVNHKARKADADIRELASDDDATGIDQQFGDSDDLRVGQEVLPLHGERLPLGDADALPQDRGADPRGVSADGGGLRTCRKGVPRRTVAVIDSAKPRFTADLIAAEATAVDAGGLGLQTLVWTVYDEESAILGRLLKGSPFTFEVLNGKTSTAERAAILERFRSGQTRVLISRAAMLGYGMNFQFVGSMVFSGWTFSYESFYQAVRRAYRHGQTRAVRVHLPVIPELEGQMYDAIVRKQAQHEQAIAEMESSYVAAREAVTGAKEAA